MVMIYMYVLYSLIYVIEYSMCIYRQLFTYNGILYYTIKIYVVGIIEYFI